MTVYQDTLKEMINAADGQAANITANVVQIDVMIDELQDQIEAIINAVTTPAQTNLANQLETVQVPYWDALYPGAYADYDGDFGTIGYGNVLTGWRIQVDDPLGFDPPSIVYEYEGAGWTGHEDAVIIQAMSDWSFGNDYLTRPLDTGATYGLIPYQASLQTASSILQANSAKVTASKTVFDRYD